MHRTIERLSQSVTCAPPGSESSELERPGLKLRGNDVLVRDCVSPLAQLLQLHLSILVSSVVSVDARPEAQSEAPEVGTNIAG